MSVSDPVASEPEHMVYRSEQFAEMMGRLLFKAERPVDLSPTVKAKADADK